MTDAEAEQVEDFDINEQVLNNLSPEDKILFKLRVSKPLMSIKSTKKIFLIMVVLMLGTSLITLIIKGVEQFFSNPFLLISIIAIVGAYFFITKVGNKPTPEQLYLTNKELFKIYGGKGGGDVKSVPLEDIQAISYIKTKRFAKNFDLEIISERINYYSKYSKGRSFNYPVIEDFHRIKKTIESILWYQCDLKERLESKKDELDIKIPHKFNNLKFSSTITLYSDKIIYEEGDYNLEIPFSSEFYMTYQPWTKKTGFIHIKPSYDSVDKIKFKLDKTYFTILEIIYLHLLSWKFKNGHLLDRSALEKQQTKPLPSIIEPRLDERAIKIKTVDLELEAVDLEQEVLNPYRDHIREGEKVLFFYIPKILNRTLILLSILTVTGLFAFVHAMFTISDPPNDILLGIIIPLLLLMYGAIFGMAGPCYILLYLAGRFSKYIFTSEKIIMSQFSKIGSTPYSNISSITYKEVKSSRHITIKLKSPLKSDQFVGKKSLGLSFVPKRLEIFERLQILRKKHMMD